MTAGQELAGQELAGQAVVLGGRDLTADDVADTVRYLVSPAAGGITGADVNITGGLVMY